MPKQCRIKNCGERKHLHVTPIKIGGKWINYLRTLKPGCKCVPVCRRHFSKKCFIGKFIRLDAEPTLNLDLNWYDFLDNPPSHSSYEERPNTSQKSKNKTVAVEPEAQQVAIELAVADDSHNEILDIIEDVEYLEDEILPQEINQTADEGPPCDEIIPIEMDEPLNQEITLLNHVNSQEFLFDDEENDSEYENENPAAVDPTEFQQMKHHIYDVQLQLDKLTKNYNQMTRKIEKMQKFNKSLRIENYELKKQLHKVNSPPHDVPKPQTVSILNGSFAVTSNPKVTEKVKTFILRRKDQDA